MTPGENLRQLRVSKNLSDEDLAVVLRIRGKAVDLDLEDWGLLEDNRSPFTLGKAALVADILRMSLRDLHTALSAGAKGTNPKDDVWGNLTVGGAIRQARRFERVKQIDLARKAGLAQSYISSVERGGVTPRLDNMLKIADALNYKLDEILPFTLSFSYERELREQNMYADILGRINVAAEDQQLLDSLADVL